MPFRKFIIILPFLWGGMNANAQVPQEPSSSMPEQWQLTLDVIKSKAQTLMIENNGLHGEYQQLVDETQKLQQAVYNQQKKNEEMRVFLKDRHGRTDQQVRVEELTQTIKAKKQQATTFDAQLANLQRKQSNLEHNIEQVRNTISDLQFHQQAQKQQAQVSPQPVLPQGDDGLSTWRTQLEDQNRQEVILENELAELKTGDKVKGLNVEAVEAENKQLEARLEVLRLQKVRHVNNLSTDGQAETNALRYNELKKRKDELEAGINAYEFRLDQLRQSSLTALSWPLKKKQLVHQMVQKDARNNQMRDQIKVMREDIDVLRDQVARLERRLDFAQGKDTK